MCYFKDAAVRPVPGTVPDLRHTRLSSWHSLLWESERVQEVGWISGWETGLVGGSQGKSGEGGDESGTEGNRAESAHG